MSDSRHVPATSIRNPAPWFAIGWRAGWIMVVCMAAWSLITPEATAGDVPELPNYNETIEPLLEQYCYKCHGFGANKGGVALDLFPDEKAAATDPKLWDAVLKNLRSGIMPPADKPRPSGEEQRMLVDWIKRGAFGIDPADPDPGRVTVRRLNRVEYRNTIRDLLGFDFDTSAEFPPDDTGHGFDNNGDVLTISPLLLEKYFNAANSIIARAVPTVAKIAPEQKIPGRRFRLDGEDDGRGDFGPPALSYYKVSGASATENVEHDGRYQLLLDLSANERFVDGQFDSNRCRVVVSDDGEQLLSREFGREDNKSFHFEFDRDWKAGPHTIKVAVEPLTPDQKQVRSLSIRIQSATIRGPMDERHWVHPPDYARFFPGEVPEDPAARKRYARDLLGRFAERAFRRPVDDAMKDRLANLAEAVTTQGGRTFESGVAQTMAAILTSPRFLFREESADPTSTGAYPLVDEYALASRLSYFLWSSMPDDELFRLAGEHALRANLKAQVDRMLADPRSAEFMRNFVGQWLQTRDIESVIINAPAVMSRDQVPDPDADKKRERFRALMRKPPEELTADENKELQEIRGSFFGRFRRFREFELTGELRRAMRRETEMLFEHIIRDDRPLLELVDCNYTFLNEQLAKAYGIEGIQGDSMRLVPLPEGSPRGGILTQGTVLAVTSNPDRTSPVKRGLFILDNILGSPPAPPPPNLPPLEDSAKQVNGRTPTLREAMVLHRSAPSCMACHARMDPLGLALENFNALGRWRDTERADPVDASGTLISGEPFKEIRELKKILVDRHHEEIYRCVTEKLLTYALGRGLEPYDAQTVDSIVDRLESNGGHASALIGGIIESAPFQKRRRSVDLPSAGLPHQSPDVASSPSDKGAEDER